MADEDRKNGANAATAGGRIRSSRMPGCRRCDFHGFVNPPLVRASTVLFENVDAMLCAPRRPLFLRPDQHADDRGADDGADRARGQRRPARCSCPPGLAAVTTAILVGGAAGQDDPRPRQRLRADAPLLRREPARLRRRDGLLRPADRRRHRRAARRRLRRSSWRRPARTPSRCRTCRPMVAAAQGGRRHDHDRQHLGDAAHLPAARARHRPRDLCRHEIPGRPFRPPDRLDLGQRSDLAGAEAAAHESRHAGRHGGDLADAARAAHHGRAAGAAREERARASRAG